MSRLALRHVLLGGCVAGLMASADRANAQAPPVPRTTASPAASAKPPSAELILLQALANEPTTAPYRFSASAVNGKLRLSGRVGTKQVHDVAIRIALGLTPSIDDRVVIDTFAAHQAAGVPLASQPIPGFSTPGAPLTVGYNSGLNGPGFVGYRAVGGFVPTYTPFYGPYGSAPYIYPQPLFGRIDEPFYGFEPPVASFAPGFAGSRRADPNAATTTPPAVDPTPPPDPTPAIPSASNPGQNPGDVVEMTLDPRGVAILRGTVPTMSDRLAVGQKAAKMDGVTDVINLLTVRGDAASAPAPPAANVPPPPPVPAGAEDQPAAPVQVVPQGEGRGKAGDDSLDQRLATAFGKRPGLAGMTVNGSVRDGVAYLSGKVPTVLEAMTAFRAAQQTPGVRDVVDRIEFTVPDGQGKNPLIEKGRPEDVEPYLEAQVRRQIGDQAHIDRVRVAGDRVEIKGTVPKATDTPRVEAVLRSTPVLRGFKVQSEFLPE